MTSLLEACDVLEESFTARRSLLFNNPGVPMGATTHTLLMGIQMIKPGEIAWAHRHTLAAVRFVVKGDGKVFTVVNGEKCPMEPNDLILTPQWTWHDHQNPTQETAMWVDVLDVPFMLGLNQPFYEPYPGDKVQAVRAKASEHLQQRAGLVRPAWENPQKENLPLRYRWKDVEPQLRALADQPGSPYDGLALEYVNPITGGPYLADAQLLDSTAAAGRAYEKASPYFERGLLRRRRRGHDDRRRQGPRMDQERLLRRAQLGLARACQSFQNRRSVAVLGQRCADRQRLRPLPRGAGGVVADRCRCRRCRRSGTK